MIPEVGNNSEDSPDGNSVNFRLILDALGDAIHIVDTDLRIVYQNRAFSQWLSSLGLETSIVGKTIAEAFPFLPGEVLEEYMRAFSTGDVQEATDHLSIEGRMVHTETRRIPVIEHSTVQQVITIIRDITERYTAQEAITESEERFTQFANALPSPVFIKDEDSRIIYANEFMRQRFYPTGWEDKHTSELFSESLSTDMEESDQQALQKGPTELFQEVPTLTGETRYYKTHKFPIRREGKPTLIGGIAIDITDLHHAQHALGNSEERYRLLYENLSDALFLTDEEGFITFSSEKACHLFRYSSNELMHMHFTRLVVPSSRESLVRGFEDRLKTMEEDKEGFEAEGIRKDGTTFTFHITNTVLVENGKAKGYQSLIRDISESKKARVQIKKSEKRYRDLFEQSNDAIFILDLNGDQIELNQRAEEMFGYSSHLVVGTPFQRLVANEDLEASRSRWESLVSGKEIPVYEQAFRRSDGSQFVGEVKVTLIREADGSPLHYLAIVRDVTLRKKAETELHQQRDRAQMYLDIVGVMVVALNSRGEITLLNQKGLDSLGYEEHEVIGRNWFDLMIPDEQRAETRDVFSQLMEGKVRQVHKFENKIKSKSGEDLLVSWQNTVLRNENGRIIGTLSSGEDITEERKMIETIQDEKERYQVLFETAPIAIGVADDKGIVRDVNWSMREMLGYTEKELRSMNASDVYATSLERDRITEALEEQGSVRDLEVLFKRKDGILIEALVNVDYVDYNDDLVRLTTIRDITELNAIRREFEGARARAEFYNDLMAHDLNNVHQGILVGAELALLQANIPENVRTHVTAIKDQVSRGIDLIDNVRKLSRMDATTEPELIKTDLHGIILKAVMLAQHAFPQKKPRIDIRFASGEVMVLADEFLIDLFYNMVHNALKYSSDEEPVVIIETEGPSDDGFVDVAIIDEGPGIPPSRKETLFSRLEMGRTLGSGMGLTLVRHITERYGGRTWVEDRIPGVYSKGSKFMVELPVTASP